MSNSASGDFVHLHAHTEYSMLDGAARVKELFAEAARMEMPALAITDHGNLFGAYDFWKAGTAAGVKPIIGMEGYYVPIGSRFDRAPFSFGADVGQDVGDEGTAKGKVNYTHMTLLAEDNEGLHNLFRISSLASLEGQYRKYPRFDRDLLERHGKGIIATTGCPSGEVNRWLQVGPVREGAPGRGRLPRHPGPGQLLLRAHGPRHRDRAPHPCRAAPPGQGPEAPAAGDQRPALHARRGRGVP